MQWPSVAAADDLYIVVNSGRCYRVTRGRELVRLVVRLLYRVVLVRISAAALEELLLLFVGRHLSVKL